MFRNLNKEIIQHVERSVGRRLAKEEMRECLFRIKAVENEYKTVVTQGSPRQEIENRISSLCNVYSHRYVIAIPEPRCANRVYMVIAERPYNRSYTVCRYNIITNLLEPQAYDLDIIGACDHIGLNVRMVL